MWPFKDNKEKIKENREKEIPELPELPELPPLPEFQDIMKTKSETKNELSPLPSFPYTQTGERMSQETIKQTVEQELPSARKTKEINYTAPFTRITKEITPSIKPEPVFVRIDKYNQASSQFQEIKRKLVEIENLLRDIKEIKAREDIELEQWEQEIQDAKSKLNSIDKTIFQKLEE